MPATASPSTGVRGRVITHDVQEGDYILHSFERQEIPSLFLSERVLHVLRGKVLSVS